MTIDSSALIAILRGETEKDRFLEAVADAAERRISAVTYVETAAVVEGTGDPVAGRKLDEFLESTETRIEPVTVEQAELARAAYRDFGRGRGHKARLNMGDCFSYALAKSRREPLLFKGRDFIHTDVRAAIPLE